MKKIIVLIALAFPLMGLCQDMILRNNDSKPLFGNAISMYNCQTAVAYHGDEERKGISIGLAGKAFFLDSKTAESIVKNMIAAKSHCAAKGTSATIYINDRVEMLVSNGMGFSAIFSIDGVGQKAINLQKYNSMVSVLGELLK